jgi:hypothetical protein
LTVLPLAKNSPLEAGKEMQVSKDIRLEKYPEAMYDHMWSRLPSNHRDGCEALRFVGGCWSR